MIHVTVLFFAHYQDVVGVREQRLLVPNGRTVAAVASDLERMYPALVGLLSHGRVAVNAEFADGFTSICDGDEIAWMPPMSGGTGGDRLA